MGLLGYAAKKAVQTAATKSVIKAVADATVETIGAVGDAKAKVAEAKNGRVAEVQRKGLDNDVPAMQNSQFVAQTIVAPTASLQQSSCSHCGATLRISSDRTEFFCEYCGSKNYLTNPAVSVTHTQVDKARIREAESREAIRIKELEVELERIKSHRDVEVAKTKGKKQHWFVTLVKFLLKLAIVYFVAMIALAIVFFVLVVR